jgi:hypothetical protein
MRVFAEHIAVDVGVPSAQAQHPVFVHWQWFHNQVRMVYLLIDEAI